MTAHWQEDSLKEVDFSKNALFLNLDIVYDDARGFSLP